MRKKSIFSLFDEFFEFDQNFDELNYSNDLTESNPNLDYHKEEGVSDGRNWTKETWEGDGTYITRTHIKKSYGGSDDIGNNRSDLRSLKYLKRDLKKAIKDERFEEAAEIRDEIKKYSEK